VYTLCFPAVANLILNISTIFIPRKERSFNPKVLLCTEWHIKLGMLIREKSPSRVSTETQFGPSTYLLLCGVLAKSPPCYTGRI